MTGSIPSSRITINQYFTKPKTITFTEVYKKYSFEKEEKSSFNLKLPQFEFGFKKEDHWKLDFDYFCKKKEIL